MLENWSPQQQKIALYGVPLVGAVVIGMRLRANNAAAAAAAAAAKPAGNAIPTIATPSTNVVGVDQLAEYENAVTGVLDHIASAVDNLSNKPPTPTPAPPPATTPPPTVVPVPVLPHPHPTPGTPIPPPPAAPFTYTVVAGDTWNGIAAALNNFIGDGGTLSGGRGIRTGALIAQVNGLPYNSPPPVGRLLVIP